MKFSLVTLYVNDLEKSLSFYNKLLGIPILRRQPIEDGKELVFLGENGNVSLELIPASSTESYSGFSVGFDVEDLEAEKEKLISNGYPVIREFAAGPKAMLCFFEGPNGETVELVGRK